MNTEWQQLDISEEIANDFTLRLTAKYLVEEQPDGIADLVKEINLPELGSPSRSRKLGNIRLN